MAASKVNLREMDALWGRMNEAVSSFCLNVALDCKEKDKMVCALVGEELEWCGAHSYLFMASRYVDAENRAKEMQEKLDLAETSCQDEASNGAKLRKSLKQCQMAAEDNEWQFQEQLAHTNNMLQMERQGADELRRQVSEMQGKLVEVEMYLGSNKGNAVLRLEEELAETRLKLAEMEEENDRQSILRQSQQREAQRKEKAARPPLSPTNGQGQRSPAKSHTSMSKTKEMAMRGAMSVKNEEDKENALGEREQVW